MSIYRGNRMAAMRNVIIITIILAPLLSCESTPENLHTSFELDRMPQISVYALLWEFDSNPKTAALQYENQWAMITGTILDVEDDVYYLYPDHLVISAHMHDDFNTGMYRKTRGDSIILVCEIGEYFPSNILLMDDCYMPR